MTHLQTFFNIKNNFLQKFVSLNILGGINSWLQADEFVSTTDCQLLAVLWFACVCIYWISILCKLYDWLQQKWLVSMDSRNFTDDKNIS